MLAAVAGVHPLVVQQVVQVVAGLAEVLAQTAVLVL